MFNSNKVATESVTRAICRHNLVMFVFLRQSLWFAIKRFKNIAKFYKYMHPNDGICVNEKYLCDS